MSVGLDPDRDADEDGGDDAEPRGRVGEADDLLEGVDDVAPDTVAEGELELGHGLVVAVEGDAGGGEPCAQGGDELSPGAHVEPEALFLDPARHRRGEERLAGVEDVSGCVAVVVRRAEGGGTRPEVGLVEDEQRCPELRREVADVDPGEADRAPGQGRAVGARGTRGPDPRRQGVERLGVGGQGRRPGRREDLAVPWAGGVGAHSARLASPARSAGGVSRAGRSRPTCARERSPRAGQGRCRGSGALRRTTTAGRC